MRLLGRVLREPGRRLREDLAAVAGPEGVVEQFDLDGAGVAGRLRVVQSASWKVWMRPWAPARAICAGAWSSHQMW
ncbi:hypothetical protein ADK41_25555 [Streptomyces caelestis]|uniref:Uncharacterized protein n=1 Tax=Streptomyces caelestis TaxID=36816 RepID=A0A0M8QIP7_9ACTN|nr:hypothetical protein ADK41_25555 [Streptomyces caelestis]